MVKPQSWQYQGIIFSLGSTGTKVFHPLTPAMDGTNISSVRVALRMESTTGDLQATLAIQSSDDGDNWGSASDVSGSPTVDDNETLFGNSFLSIATPTATCKYFRLGVNAWNISGSNRELAYISMRLEFRAP